MGKPKFPILIRRDSVVVKIYRNRHPRTASRYSFTVAWSVGGRRYLLQRASLAKAQTEAAAKAEQLAAGKFAAARDLTQDDVAVLATARRLCGQVPMVAALEEWHAARKLCGGPILPAARAWADTLKPTRAVTVPDAVVAFLSAKDRAGVNTDASYRTILPHLKDRFSGPIASVTAPALETWIHDRFKQPGQKHAHPVTFNTARKRLVALWRWCRKQGYLPRNAQTEAEQLEMAREPTLEIGIMRVGEFARLLVLLQAEHPEYLAAAVVAGFCGLRSAEIHGEREAKHATKRAVADAGQKWKDVYLDRSLLRVSKAKRNTPSKRLVPLCDAAKAWLALCPRTNDENEDLAPAWAMDRIRAFARGATPPIPCPENAFRHSYISYRVAATGNVHETALEAGNSDTIVHKHYRELVSKDEGLAWFGLTPKRASEIVSALPSSK